MHSLDSWLLYHPGPFLQLGRLAACMVSFMHKHSLGQLISFDVRMRTYRKPPSRLVSRIALERMYGPSMIDLALSPASVAGRLWTHALLSWTQYRQHTNRDWA